ncbi:MAG TPA: VOC family protein [Rhodanobacteraceae bacterium]|nr:VOC family protein [Rhodanobacteraceae bacterium]
MATKKKASKKAATRKASGKPARRSAPARKKSAAKKAPAKKPVARKTAASARADVPSLFRINVEVGSLDDADRFYGELFGIPGRRQAGSRVYFQCGPVTLQVVDVSSMGMGVPHPAAKALYFIVDDLDAVFARAAKLGCLSQELVHGSPGGAISVRPWGERSFYAEDKWLNPLCFVEAGTTYPG